MSETFVLLVIGFLLIVLLLAYRFQRLSIERSAAVPTLDQFSRFATRRTEVLTRILDSQDWDFVRKHGSVEVQRLFHIERRELAFEWLSEIRNQARGVMHFHLAHARQSEKILPRQEFRLAFEYAAIRFKCALTAALLWLAGPRALRTVSGMVGQLSEQLRTLIERSSQPVSSVSGNLSHLN